MSYPIVSNIPSKQAFYVEMREKGMEHRGAEMLALQAAPRCMTDAVRFEGVGTLEQQMGERQAEFIVNEAKKKGFTPTYRMQYMANMAMSPGDPEAFVSDRNDVERLKRRQAKPTNIHKQEHNELVDKVVAKIAKRDRNFAKAGIKEQRQEVRRRHFTRGKQ